MQAHSELNITVIYSDSGVVSPTIKQSSSAGRLDARRMLGCLTLLVAGAWLFATWFPISHFLRKELMWVSLSSLDVSQFFGPPPANLANPAQPNRNNADDSLMELKDTPEVSAHKSGAASSLPQGANRHAKTQVILKRLTGANYAWVTTMTIAGCWLAIVGGASVGGWLTGSDLSWLMRLLAILMFAVVAIVTWSYWPSPGEKAELPQILQYAYAGAFALLALAVCANSSKAGAVWMFVLGLVVLGAYGGLLWRSYPGGWGIPLFAWPALWFGVMVVTALLGAALSSHVRGLTSAAVVLIFVSCLATVVGIWYGQRNGGFLTYTPTVTTYLGAVLIQSSFAWFLLVARVAVR